MEIDIEIRNLNGDTITFKFDDSRKLIELYTKVEESEGSSISFNGNDKPLILTPTSITTDNKLIFSVEKDTPDYSSKYQPGEIIESSIREIAELEIKYQRDNEDKDEPARQLCSLNEFRTYKLLRINAEREQKQKELDNNIKGHLSWIMGVAILAATYFVINDLVLPSAAKKNKEEDTIKDLAKPCGHSLMDTNFEKRGNLPPNPNIGTQNKFDDWEKCQSLAKSTDPDNVCPWTRFYDKYDRCAQNDLNDWCYKKGIVNPSILVSDTQYKNCQLRYEASQRRLNAQTKQAGSWILFSLIEALGLYCCDKANHHLSQTRLFKTARAFCGGRTRTQNELRNPLLVRGHDNADNDVILVHINGDNNGADNAGVA